MTEWLTWTDWLLSVLEMKAYLAECGNQHHFCVPLNYSTWRACCCLVTKLGPTLCDPMNCNQPGSSVHGDSSGQIIGVGGHALFQRIFLSQGSNPHFLHWKWILYEGSPVWRSAEPQFLGSVILDYILPSEKGFFEASLLANIYMCVCVCVWNQRATAGQLVLVSELCSWSRAHADIFLIKLICSVLRCSVVSDPCDPTDCSPPGSSVHGVLQARILEWVVMPSSRGSSQPRDWNLVFCITGSFFTIWATREAHEYWCG